MKQLWVCDEEGLSCSQCGKDIYRCECADDSEREEDDAEQ